MPFEVYWFLWLVALGGSFGYAEYLAVRGDRSDDAENVDAPEEGRTLSAWLRRKFRHPLAKWVSGATWGVFSVWFFLHIWFPSLGL